MCFCSWGKGGGDCCFFFFCLGFLFVVFFLEPTGGDVDLFFLNPKRSFKEIPYHFLQGALSLSGSF